MTGLTAAEAEAVLLMGLPGPASDLGLAEPDSVARLKLIAALPATAGDSARRVADRFHLDPVDWYRRTSPPKHLAAVAAAVWDQRRIVICYESWKGQVERALDPLGLVLKAGHWYLVARAEESSRTYRVANILDLSVGEQRFDRPEDFDLARHWQAEVARFEASLHRETATLRVTPNAMPMIDRLGADAAEAIAAAEPDPQGVRSAVIPIESLAHAAGLLLGFGNRVEVLAPAALREEMRRSAVELVELYGGPKGGIR